MLSDKSISIPVALTCDGGIQDTRSDIATPEIARLHPHVAHVAKYFTEYDADAEVMILIGRDCGVAMADQVMSTVEPPLDPTRVRSSGMCLHQR